MLHRPALWHAHMQPQPAQQLDAVGICYGAQFLPILSGRNTAAEKREPSNGVIACHAVCAGIRCMSCLGMLHK